MKDINIQTANRKKLLDYINFLLNETTTLERRVEELESKVNALQMMNKLYKEELDDAIDLNEAYKEKLNNAIYFR